MDDRLDIERLIRNIRVRLNMGMSVQDIAADFQDVDQGQVYLAYRAAQLLNADLDAMKAARKRSEDNTIPTKRY